MAYRPPPPPPVPGRVSFSLTPSTEDSNTPLDLTTRFGKSIHDNVTAPFTTQFDGEPDSCLGFIEQVMDRISAA